MLDIRFIRNNPDLVQTSTKNKGYDVDVSSLLQLDEERRDIQNQADELRERRNKVASQMKNGKPEPDLISEGRSIKAKLVEIEEKFKLIDDEYTKLLES